MSGATKKPGQALVPRTEYEVGYGKPPEHSRFRKGQSGNPRGRPKGAKNKLPRLNEERMKTIILQEAYREITVRDGARNVTVPMAQAIIRAMAVNAAKGQHRAQRLFAELLAATETANKALSDAYLASAIDYKEQWDRELDRRRRSGTNDLPDPVPHPDQITIDMVTGMPCIRGPMTKEDKALVDKWAAHAPQLAKAVADLRDALEDETDPEERADIEAHVSQGEKLLAKLREAGIG